MLHSYFKHTAISSDVVDFKANTVRILIRVAVKSSCLNLGSCLRGAIDEDFYQTCSWSRVFVLHRSLESAFAASLKLASLASGLLENFHPVS